MGEICIYEQTVLHISMALVRRYDAVVFRGTGCCFVSVTVGGHEDAVIGSMVWGGLSVGVEGEWGGQRGG